MGKFQKGNPGRPKGSRNAMGPAFTKAMVADFEEFGPDTIRKVREEKPEQYLSICAKLVPQAHIVDAMIGSFDFSMSSAKEWASSYEGRVEDADLFQLLTLLWAAHEASGEPPVFDPADVISIAYAGLKQDESVVRAYCSVMCRRATSRSRRI